MRTINIIFRSLLMGMLFAPLPAWALSFEVEDWYHLSPIPERHALCRATEEGGSAAGENRRPTLRWRHAPAGTRSFVLLLTDPDVPADLSLAGQPEVVIGVDAPRQTFVHWAVANIPVRTRTLPGGTLPLRIGTSLASDLGGYVKNDTQYGGPCPPTNDARLHRYHFTLLALDVPRLGLTPDMNGQDLLHLLEENPHVLARSTVTGVYSLNPTVDMSVLP